MSLFSSLFGKKPEPEEAPAPQTGPGAPAGFFPEGVDMSDWDQVFSACLGKMYTVQHAFLDLVRGEEGWYIDFEKGTLTLGKQEFRVQFLGSESYVSNSWLWGWENINNFPDNILGQTHIARTYGQAWSLEPLMYAQCELNDTFNGHNFSMVVCGALAEDRCYYRCPTGEGQGGGLRGPVRHARGAVCPGGRHYLHQQREPVHSAVLSGPQNLRGGLSAVE